MGLRPAFLAPFAGQPEIVFPSEQQLPALSTPSAYTSAVGELAVRSSVSGQIEYYAVIASLIGAKGELCLLPVPSRRGPLKSLPSS
jgi:hypothetical protein